MHVKPLPTEAQLIAEREKELKKECKVLVDTYYADKVIKYKEVVLISQQFTDLVKKYLKKTV